MSDSDDTPRVTIRELDLTRSGTLLESKKEAEAKTPGALSRKKVQHLVMSQGSVGEVAGHGRVAAHQAAKGYSVKCICGLLIVDDVLFKRHIQMMATPSDAPGRFDRYQCTLLGKTNLPESWHCACGFIARAYPAWRRHQKRRNKTINFVEEARKGGTQQSEWLRAKNAAEEKRKLDKFLRQNKGQGNQSKDDSRDAMPPKSKRSRQ
jgi:hypothetical protein